MTDEAQNIVYEIMLRCGYPWPFDSKDMTAALLAMPQDDRLSLARALAGPEYALVPVEVTDEMRERMATIADGPVRSYDEYWAEMLDAAIMLAAGEKP